MASKLRLTMLVLASMLSVASCSRGGDGEAVRQATRPLSGATATSASTPAPKPTHAPTPLPTPGQTTAPQAPPILTTDVPESIGIPVPTPEGGITVDWARAVDLFNLGYVLQMQGRLRDAIETYGESIATYPTAEAYTFLGWTYSWMGLNDRAIAEAKRAIKLDPEYGNPYNDIGAYLLDEGEFEQAVQWLERATRATRYETPHYPYVNLGRVWVLRGDWDQAMAMFAEVVKLTPGRFVAPLPNTVPLTAHHGQVGSEPSPFSYVGSDRDSGRLHRCLECVRPRSRPWIQCTTIA